MPTVRTNDAEIYYETHGQGQPFLFFSETACDGQIWKLYQVPEFAKDHMVIIHDYRGTGRSSKPSVDYTTQNVLRRRRGAARSLERSRMPSSSATPWAGGWRNCSRWIIQQRVKKLILASTGASFPGGAGLPLQMCKEMIEWGYEKYVREHTIQVGFTDEFVKSQPERLEAFFRQRLENICPVEFYLRHVLSRQGHDTSGRLKDIRMPTLVMVGELEGDPNVVMTHRMSSDILAKGIPNAKFVMLPKQKHNYFTSDAGAGASGDS